MVSMFYLDWECKDANEELNFNEWNKNFEDDENLDRLESMLKEEITKYKANNKWSYNDIYSSSYELKS